MSGRGASRRASMVVKALWGLLACAAAFVAEGTGERQDRHRRREKGDGVTCRVALCLSGAIRSFVHPVVHGSIRGNLIEAIEADGCEVDVFAYATRTDTVGAEKKKVLNSEFISNACEVEIALAALEPTRLVWHQEQAGIIPNSCEAAGRIREAPTEGVHHDDDGNLGKGGVRNWTWSTWQLGRPDASSRLYWQLYKSLAAYRMALREEERRGEAYEWIIRGRFDLAWVRPLPPLQSFSRESVWFGRHYWPMSDQFAIVPRALSDRFFAAVSTFYGCDGQSWPAPVSWWQPGCRECFEESVLFRHLHASHVPHRTYFMFEYVITRGAHGGVCNLGEVVFGEACDLLNLAGALQPPLNSHGCREALGEWANLRCRALLPAEGMGDSRRTDIISTSNPRVWEELVSKSSPPSLAAVRAAGARAGAAAEAVEKGSPSSNKGGHSQVAKNTTVPTVDEVELVRSKLIALRDAVQPQPEGRASMFDDFEFKNSTRSSRWDGWGTLPPWSVCSYPKCPLAEPQFPGLSPHIVTYYTMGTHLLRELAQALRCFLNGAVGETRRQGGGFDASSCEGVRALELVMVDVALHTEELGICTADGNLGLSGMDHVLRFFSEPALHCQGYGNMGEN